MSAFTLAATIFVVGVLFLLFREAMTWYWKIDVIIERLDNIVTELKKINEAEE